MQAYFRALLLLRNDWFCMKQPSLFLLRTGNFRQSCVVVLFFFFKGTKNNVQTL